MRALKINQACEARVWFDDELPRMPAGTAFEPGDLTPLESEHGTGSRRAAIEIRMRMGPRTLFGFLDCAMWSDGGNQALRISAGREIPNEAAATMAGWFKSPITFGLTDEYKAGVLEGAKEAETIFPTRGKTAVFRIAVHDAVGSAPVVFKFLSRSLIGILCSEGWPPSDEITLQILNRGL